MMKSILSTAVKVGVSLAILYFLFRNINVNAFWNTFISVNPLSVVFVAVLFICTQSISTFRWSVILKKDIDIPYRRLLS
ncbi:MAG: flippase-like domain-containing protein, partial [Deltaproteobacteria bacterium]|nr:flippase-like domain-containing protein [Deltaproteobacteria bacterium]